MRISGQVRSVGKFGRPYSMFRLILGDADMKKGIFRRVVLIPVLALLAFGVMDVNDLAFNEKLQGNEKALQTLQDLFPTEKNWINEWY